MSTINCSLMEIEPKEENPWLSQVEIWNKKLEDQKWRELLELEIKQQKELQQEKELQQQQQEKELQLEKELQEKEQQEKEERAEKKLQEENMRMIERVGQWNSHNHVDSLSLFTEGFGSKVPPIQVQYFINNNHVPIASAAEESCFKLQKSISKSKVLPKHLPKHLPLQELEEQEEMDDTSVGVVTKLDQSNQPSLPFLLPPRTFQSTNHYHPSKWTLSFLFYACFLFISISSLILLSWHFLSSLHKDISIKLSNQYALLNKHILQCAHDWQINGCDTVAKSIPHMSTICKEWQECMHQDPENIDRMVVLGNVFSALCNSFIDPLSWKVVLVGTVWASILMYTFTFLYKPF